MNALPRWKIITDDVRGPEIRALLEQHFADMLANSPKDSTHFLDFEGLRAPGVTFWSIWADDQLAGCGALRDLSPDHGEIKSMRTAEAFRGRGVAKAMLGHILATARQRGHARISLETGSSPAFGPANALYAKFGFMPCPPFGDYKDDPFSRYYTLAL